MTAAPTETPVTTPVTLTVATDDDAELQVPPETPSVSVIEEPVQTEPGPEIAPGETVLD